MKIQKLILKNFRNIESTELEFEEGLYVINGENGEGKTSLLKAFALLFCNETENSLKDEIRWGADSFYLKILFTHQGKSFDYDVKYDGGSERNLTIDKKDYYKNSAAVDKIKEYFDPKLAMASMIVMQGEADLVSVKPAERRDLLKKIFNLQFSEELSKLTQQKNEIELSIVDLNKRIYSLTNKSYDFKEKIDYPFESENYESKELLLEKLILEKNNQEQKIKEYERTKELLLEIGDEIEKIGSSIKSKQSQIDNVQEEIEDLNILDYSDSEFKISKLREKIESGFDGTVKEIEAELLEKSNSVEESTSEDYRKQLLFVEDQIEQQQKELYSISASIKQIQKTLNDCESGICPVCSKEFDDHDTSELEKEKETIEGRGSLLEEELKDLKSSKATIENNLSSVTSKEKHIESLKERLNREKEFSEKEKKTADEHLQELILSLEKEKEYTQSKIEDNKKKIGELEKDIDELSSNKKYKAQKYSELNKSSPNRKPVMDPGIEEKILSLKNEIEQYKKTVTWNEQVEAWNSKVVKEREENHRELETLNSSLENSQKELNVVEEAIKLYRSTFPTFIISNKIEQHQLLVNTFLADVYSKHKVLFKENKNTLKMLYGAKEAEVSNASGFERQVFSMAYKYALSQENDYGVLFLDEVDSFASEKNSQLFYETIGKMEYIYNQVFVISQKKNTKEILEREFNAKILNVENGVFEYL